MSDPVIASTSNSSGSISKRRSIILIAFSLVFILLSTAAVFLSSITGPDVLQNPVSVYVRGLTIAESKEMDVSVVSVGAIPNLLKMRCCHTEENPFKWSISPGIWIASLYLHASEPVLGHIKSLTVTVGPAARTFSSNEILAWNRAKVADWVLPRCKSPVISLQIPRVSSGQMQGINIPSFVKLAENAALRSLAFFFFCGSFLFVLSRFVARQNLPLFLQRALSGLSTEENCAVRARDFIRDGVPFLAGLAIVSAGLAILYTLMPYPFTQDDNFSQFLPVILRSAETLAGGHFPVWNPYQLLGAPTATVGTYALTYPPIYLAYWTAHSILHNDNATIEVFCICHLLCGYVVTFIALRLSGLEGFLSAAGALCWILSGWFLVGGRSQCNFTPYAVFLPLLIALVNRLGRGPVGIGWVALTGFAGGVLFHAGHAEFWIYSLVFCALATLLMFAGGVIPISRLIYAFSAFLVALAVASPLLWLQKWETDGILRIGGTGWSSDIMDMLFPFVALCTSSVKSGSVNYQWFPEIFYAGTVFFASGIAVLGLCIVALVFLPQAIKTRELLKNQWLLLGGLAFVMSLGAPAVLWTLISFLPIFNRFRWPIKYTSFLHIFLIFGAGLVLERLIPRRGKSLVFVITSALMLFHVTQCRSSLYDFADRPYPILPAPMEQLLTGESAGRIYCLVPIHSASPDFIDGLVLNFPTVFKIFSYQGYDTFIASKEQYVRTLNQIAADPVKTAKAYGIEWMLWSELEKHPILSNPSQNSLELCQVGDVDVGGTLLQQAKNVYQSSKLKIFRLNAFDPLVFVSDTPGKSLSFMADQSGLTINSAALSCGTAVTANFLAWPWMAAEANGKKLTITPDSWMRISVKLQESAPQIRIFYSPPWQLSSLIGLAILVAGILLGLVAYSVQRRENKTLIEVEKDY